MKVTGLSWTAFRLPLRAPFQTAGGPVTHREGLIVRLMTDAGTTGLGEASPHPALGRAGLNEVEAAISGLAPGLLRAEAERLHDRLPHTVPRALMCALSTATLDAVARCRGIPLAQLLAAQHRREVPVNATIASASDVEAASQAAVARKAGFRCVKLKVGMAPNPEGERKRVAAVRSSLGPDIRLRLDANGAWSVEQAVRVIRGLAEFSLEYIEQPVEPGNLAGMARVRREGGVPIAADEDVAGPETAHAVMESAAADVLVVKPMVTGSLHSGVDVAAIAARAGASAVVTTTVDAGIGTTAALHLAAVLPEDSPACGLATGSLLASDIIAGLLEVRGGIMALPRGPGLGVDLDERALARYATSAGEVTA